jgi:hypothetical protein
MCFGGPLPEKKSEENVSRDEHERHSKQNDGRSSHSAGCHGGAGDIKYQLISFLAYLSVVIAIIWFLPHRPVP